MEVVYPFIPASCFFKLNGAKYKDVTTKDVVEYVHEHYLRFVMHSRLFKLTDIETSFSQKLWFFCNIPELPSVIPDCIILGEHRKFAVFVHFYNPFDWKNPDHPLFISQEDTRRLMSYITFLKAKSEDPSWRILLISNYGILANKMKLLLANYIVPIPITDKMIKAIARRKMMTNRPK